MRDYALVALTTETLDEVASAWRAEAGADEFELELSVVFDWAQENASRRPGQGHARGLRNQSTGGIDAILETVPSPNISLTKLLKIYLRPKFWGADPDAETLDHLVAVHAGAYVEVIAEARQDDINEVKLYGRDSFALVLLTAVQRGWDSAATGWSATLQGRWLSLKRV